MYRSKIIWSVVGLVLPLLSAAVFFPVLLARLQAERFGIMALAWSLLSAASVLDLGIGRATTQYVAALRGRRAFQVIPATVEVARHLSIKYSGIGCTLFLLAVLLGADALIKHHSVSDQELRHAALIIIAILPVQVLSALYRGIIEAFEDFRVTSLIRLYQGLIDFVGPFLISYVTHSLTALTGSLLAGRLIGLAFLHRSAQHHLRTLASAETRPDEDTTANTIQDSSDPAAIRQQLNRFGKWMTISNIANPLLMQADRFIIAGTLSAAVLTTYYIPYTIVIQSTILFSAITTVMFPVLTARLQADPAAGQLMFRHWRNRMTVAAAALYVVLCLAIPIILHYWMGAKTGPESAHIGQILCAGAFFFTLSVIFTSYLHAQGRVHVCAILQIIELILYIPALYFATHLYGLYGASIAWVIRALIDAVALGWAAGHRSRQPADTSSSGS